MSNIPFRYPTKKDEVITPEVMAIITRLKAAKGDYERMSAQVNAIACRVLSETEYFEEQQEPILRTASRIVNPARAWLMPEDKFAEYNAKCERIQAQHGLRDGLADGYCPALTRRTLMESIESELVGAVAPKFGIELRQIATNWKEREKLINLTLQLAALD